MDASIPAAKRHRAHPTAWSDTRLFTTEAQLEDLSGEFEYFLKDIFEPKQLEPYPLHSNDDAEDLDNVWSLSKKRGKSLCRAARSK